MNAFSLEGETARVTGANTGIGQAVADVIASGRRDCDDALSLTGGGRTLHLDFADPMAARDVFDAERIDILMNNAGIIRREDAAKHGVAGLTRLMANEWAARGFNFNAIAPGYIETNNTEAPRTDPDRSRAILDRVPAGRWGRAEDIGQPAAFLAAPASDDINGAILKVDGGWLAR